MTAIRTFDDTALVSSNVVIPESAIGSDYGLLAQSGLRLGLNLVDENDPDMWHQGWYGETNPRIYAVESVLIPCAPSYSIFTGCIRFPSTAQFYGIRWYDSSKNYISTQSLQTKEIWYALTVPSGIYYFSVFFTSNVSTTALNKIDIITGNPKVVAMFMSYKQHFSTYTEDEYVPHVVTLKEDVDRNAEEIRDSVLVNRIYGKSLEKDRFYGHGTPLYVNYNASAKTYLVAPIRITKGETYYYRHLYAYFCHLAYDDGTVYTLSNNSTGNQSGSVTADDNGWAILTLESSYIDGNVIEMPFFGEDMRACRRGIWEPRADDSVYYCEKSNDFADFDNLVEAIVSINHINDATLYVGPGTWDLVSDWEDYDSSYFTNFPSDGSVRGLELGKGIKVVFSGNSTVVCDCSSKSDNVKTYFSPFNTGYGGFTLENLTLNAKSVRYCVHDERRSTGVEQYQNHYIGCKFYLDNTENTPWTHYQVIGGGLGSNGFITFEGCQFEAKNADNSDVVTYHNNSGSVDSSARSRILFFNNYIVGRNRVRFNWYGASTAVSQMICVGNSWGLAPASSAETPSSTNQNVEIIAWNNELRSE